MSLTDFNKFNLELIDQYGKKLYQTNENYKQLANVMEHPEFKEFFDKHFDTLDNTKTILMFIKLYQNIEKSYITELNPYQKIAILDGLIKDKDNRQEIVDKFLQLSLYEKEDGKMQRIQTMPNLTYKE